MLPNKKYYIKAESIFIYYFIKGFIKKKKKKTKKAYKILKWNNWLFFLSWHSL
jgi:hypothetical protein